ncbi:MAG: diaminopimelate decarboxylase [Anaerovoracaceae bacterium]|jgi:diaminopimelate decarboxylase|nr:diaminopimelate decarboxylase [Clostridiales bacterium]
MAKEINNGILKVGGVSCDKLADTCGTPLFVYDQEELEKQLWSYKKYFRSDLFETEIIYASKAFTCNAMLHLLKQYGFGLDVVSGGELYIAHKADFPMDQVYFHGNNKTIDELELALNLRCKTIVLDNDMECKALIDTAERMQKSASVLIRVNPGITAHTHKYIITGDMDSKFGVALNDEKMLMEMIESINNSQYLSFEGFHVHIGSQIFDLKAYEILIERMIKRIKKMKTDYKIEIKALNLGGGFGVRYTEEDEPNSIREVCERIINKCEAELKASDLSIKKLMIEPGRSIVAEAGYTLYRVGYLKQTPNISYIFVDGGMTDNIRKALYDAKYECDLANKMDLKKTIKYTVAGKCCESGDILIENAMLPKAQMGDLLVVYGTGAYGYSMASNYNRLNKPAVVFVKDGKTRIVIKRESYSDQLRFETDEEVIV